VRAVPPRKVVKHWPCLPDRFGTSTVLLLGLYTDYFLLPTGSSVDLGRDANAETGSICACVCC